MPYKSKKKKRLAYLRFLKNNPGYAANARRLYNQRHKARVKRQRKKALPHDAKHKRDLYKKRKARKLCVRCGKKTRPGFIRCFKCGEYHRIKCAVSKQKKIDEYREFMDKINEKIRIGIMKGL